MGFLPERACGFGDVIIAVLRQDGCRDQPTLTPHRRTAMKAARKLRQLQQPQSLLGHLRQFLTPQVCKQARHAVPRGRAHPRWDLQPLLFIVLAMTWAAGDSQAEKFQTARGFYVASYQARKRPGKTLQGFQKALSRVPMRQFQALAAGVRDQIRLRFAERLLVDAWSRWVAMDPASNARVPRSWKRGSERRARTT